MKPEDIKKLSDDALTERVAELCGGVWKPCECGKAECPKHARWHWPDGTITNGCPDYATDLNAMHDAEWTLDDPEYRKYVRVNLPLTLKRDGPLFEVKMVSADARHRAEAFVTVKS